MNEKSKTSTAADYVQTLLRKSNKGPCRYGKGLYVPAQIKELTIRDTGPIHIQLRDRSIG